MNNGSTAIINILIYSVRRTSESEVCKRQILTFEDVPRAERVKTDEKGYISDS